MQRQILAQLVELRPAGTLYRDALHPYSEGLLHSFPALRGVRRELTGIPGSPPDLRAIDLPMLGQPVAASVGGTEARSVACWLHEVRPGH
jgi:peptide/nickel transport system ATP-binding protein